MPLLKRKAFEKSKASEYLRDDDEVFHCEITDEIFKDYEEYCERIILVNSMVWTCEMTGKNNLTYSEALHSEKTARRALKDFPMELRIPILYLAMRTKRCSFAEMSEDVFNFVRDRYFVGETVEACLEGEVWREAHILSITAQKQHPDSKAMLPSTAYCYEVEQYHESDPSASGQIGTAPSDRVRRRKGVYTRDKNRLFLKQFVEGGADGVISIKKSAQEKYNISKVSFDQIFTGNPPVFPSSKKLLKSPPASKGPAKPGSASKLTKSVKKPSPDKKGRQESMDKFVKKTDKAEAQKNKPPMDPAAKKSAQEMAEKMRKAEDLMRQRKEEERLRKKEKTARLQAYMKEWQKVKDDIELEDHKVLPTGTLVEVEGIPHEHFGDFLSVLEFVHQYSEILKVKDVFHNQQLDLETFRKALTQKEHAGLFSDLVQMFLTTVFSLQEDEAEEYNENGRIQLSTGEEDKETDTEMGVTKAMELATKASKWSQTYLGTPLSKLPLDPTTVSEVLRLHLLSSGAGPGGRCATWRYQARGGYTSADDAGLRLRVQHPALLSALHSTHVADLGLEDKFLVLQCLMNQILSYATLRDVIEERLDEMKNTKQALRLLQTNERKREAQLITAKQEIRKEYFAKKEENKLTGEKARAVDEEMKAAIDKLMAESEEKKKQYEKELKGYQEELFEYTTYVGSDRAFRRYWVSRTLAGLFVEAGAEPRGGCRHKPVTPAPHDAQDTLAHVAKLFEQQKERAGSDKENESGANSRGSSPKKPLSNLNGLSQKMNGSVIDSTTQQLQDLLMCTGDITTCLVHGKSLRPRWWVFHTAEQLSALTGALNKRGLREAELRQALELDKDRILTHIAKCPLHLLNPAAAPDREAWRGTIMLRGYDKQADYLTWGPDNQYRDDYHLPNGVLKLPTDIEESDMKNIAINKYRDPGYYLEAPKVNGVKKEPPEPGAKADVVRGLASALLQVSQAINHKYLKRPLGLDDKERKDREARNKPLDLEALQRWEVSLMECKSFSQIMLHLFTLDSSVTWSASILNTSCRLCRRKTDPDNMLLCDGCNKGHHLYCLKPKLTKVPEGDWFCDVCKPKERTPRKRRKLYTEEVEQEEANSSDSSYSVDTGVCAGCGSGGRLGATCGACRARYHPECARPRPARAAKRWTCAACLAPQRETSSRRCAAAASAYITSYSRMARHRDSCDSDDSEYNVALVKLAKPGRTSKESSPVHNGKTKRGRKSKNQDQENTNERHSTGRRSKNSLTNGHHEEKSTKKRSSRLTQLHTEALQSLLRDVMKHKDCWPFYEPVSPEDVPDYLEVIDQPMDFSTIRDKLESAQYATDEDLLADAALVFLNCYTYNKDSHPVAKAGNRLEKYMNKRCAELELPSLPEIRLQDDDASSKSSKRPSPSSDEDAPLPKRAKLK
ncbi:bromodomain adjacent to zinc finger domain protein 1A-like [Spodoptera frugiperda]|uniref:Bromodomain adjacent to zinc finger domain protein 1A n=1 Tax=Spodoptera frugiperda TaxID=7108 RepID=A0A9R0EUM3_SPOFR|nr:bromodomain adjacent to zinc finger domain protein 1A-like [Spodoptera frugiperda]